MTDLDRLIPELMELEDAERHNIPPRTPLPLSAEQAVRLVYARRAIRATGFWNEFGDPIIDGHFRPTRKAP